MNAALEPAFSLHPNPVTDHIVIDAAMEGDKTVVITSSVGQKVYSGTENGKHFEISTSKFATGSYFISICDKSTGKVTSLKFVKQ